MTTAYSCTSYSPEIEKLLTADQKERLSRLQIPEPCTITTWKEWPSIRGDAVVVSQREVFCDGFVRVPSIEAAIDFVEALANGKEPVF